MSGGKVRLVRCARGELGIVVGPAVELDQDQLDACGSEERFGTRVKAIPPHLEQEAVCWWSAAARRWSPPVAAWTLELETVPITRKGALGQIIRDIQNKLRADQGLRVGSDNEQASWYAVNDALGI